MERAMATGPTNPPPVGRAAPSVSIRIRLEERPEIRYYAESAEDAERLRLWLLCRPDLVEIIAAAADYSAGVIEGPPGGADWTHWKSA
jgi:hypothetical protein